MPPQFSHFTHGAAERFRSLGETLRRQFGRRDDEEEVEEQQQQEWEQSPAVVLSAGARADHEDGDGVDPLPLYRRWAVDAWCPPPRYAPRPTGPPPVSSFFSFSFFAFCRVGVVAWAAERRGLQ